MRIGDEERGPPGGGDLEDRAARAPEDQVAGGEAVAEVGLVLEQRVALLIWSGLEPGSPARRSRGGPARWTTWKSRPSRSARAASGAIVDRAGPLAAAHHQQAEVVRGDAEARSGAVAIGREHGRRHRPAGDQVALALATLDREGEADAPGAAGEQPVGEAEVAVGLGQHQRRAVAKRGEAGGPGGEAAAAHDDVGAAGAQHPAGRCHGTQRLERRAGGLQRVAAVDPAGLDEVDLVAGGGNELGLDPLARAEEGHLGAASPKLVGDRHGGHHVTRGSPRCHHHFYGVWHCWIGSFYRRAHARHRRRAVCQRGRSHRAPR